MHFLKYFKQPLRIKTEGKARVFISLDETTYEIANQLIRALKLIFDQAHFELAYNESEKHDKIKDCDVLMVLANRQYSISEDLMKDFDDFIKFTKPLMVLNLENDVVLRHEFQAYYKSSDF